MQASFITSAQKINQCPDHNLLEIAMVGRSNCGKSTLINTLLNHKGLAKESSRPGRTALMNFFRLQIDKENELMFVDLPGYGFSKTSKQESVKWNDMMHNYFKRPQLQKICFLMDIRRKLEEKELEFLKSLQESVEILVVFTKTDKISKAETIKNKNKLQLQIEKKLQQETKSFTVSCLKKSGISELKQAVFSNGLAPRVTE